MDEVIPIPRFHFDLLTNIETLICIYPCEMCHSYFTGLLITKLWKIFVTGLHKYLPQNLKLWCYFDDDSSKFQLLRVDELKNFYKKNCIRVNLTQTITFQSIPCLYTPENIRKPEVLCFYGVQKNIKGIKWVIKVTFNNTQLIWYLYDLY